MRSASSSGVVAAGTGAALVGTAKPALCSICMARASAWASAWAIKEIEDYFVKEVLK